MYYTTKRLTTVTALLGAVNAFCTFLYFLSFPVSSFSMAMKITIGFLLITATTASLFLTIALRGLCDTLELSFENEADNIQELRQRIKLLEEITERIQKKLDK